MDMLQDAMEENIHLIDPARVLGLINGVTKFWSVLSDEDKDYIECSKYAIEEQSEWRVDETRKQKAAKKEGKTI